MANEYRITTFTPTLWHGSPASLRFNTFTPSLWHSGDPDTKLRFSNITPTLWHSGRSLLKMSAFYVVIWHSFGAAVAASTWKPQIIRHRARAA